MQIYKITNEKLREVRKNVATPYSAHYSAYYASASAAYHASAAPTKEIEWQINRTLEVIRGRK